MINIVVKTPNSCVTVGISGFEQSPDVSHTHSLNLRTLTSTPKMIFQQFSIVQFISVDIGLVTNPSALTRNVTRNMK